MITIDDFKKVDLRVGKIISAEAIPESEKLVKLLVDLGNEKRQIVAGIRISYAPEDLVGKNIVVVANLEPRTLKGIESRGMLLAASGSDGTLAILTLDREVSPGSPVS